MCRKTHLRGCLILGIGIGIFAGYTLDSWILCIPGGLLLMGLALMMLRKK